MTFERLETFIKLQIKSEAHILVSHSYPSTSGFQIRSLYDKPLTDQGTHTISTRYLPKTTRFAMHRADVDDLCTSTIAVIKHALLIDMPPHNEEAYNLLKQLAILLAWQQRGYAIESTMTPPIFWRLRGNYYSGSSP